MAVSDSVEVNHEARIAAPVDSVFPLAFPVEEYKWIPGWKCELMLQILATMLRHYCESGGLVPRNRIARLITASNALTMADRGRLLVNTLAMARKRDPLRQRYLAELAAGLR